MRWHRHCRMEEEEEKKTSVESVKTRAQQPTHAWACPSRNLPSPHGVRCACAKPPTHSTDRRTGGDKGIGVPRRS